MLWVIWDGASCDVVRELLDQGDLPALRGVCGGRVLPVAPLIPCCQTPPSLASMFTGGSIREHGVTGYRAPAREPGASCVQWRSGFEEALVTRPLIWDRAAEAGCWLGLSHAPWSTGRGAGGTDRAFVVCAYQRQLSAPAVSRLADDDRPSQISLGPFEVAVSGRGGTWEVSANSGDRVRVSEGSLSLASRTLRLAPGKATRVGVLAGPGGEARLVHTGLWDLRAEPAERQPQVDRAVGAFAGSILADAYHDGLLGPRSMEGGDGGAEAVLLESARLQEACFSSGAELILAAAPSPGLVISYLPVVDAVQHEVFRWWADTATSGAAPARDLLRRAYGLADVHLARLLRAAGPGCQVVVSSDHGAGALRRCFHVNESLRRAGLLAFDAQGQVDPGRTRAAYHPAENGSLWVNVAGRPQGLVPAAERDGVLDAVQRLLRSVRDPLTGRPPVVVARTDEGEAGLLGDLLVATGPGYECSAQAAAGGAEFADAPRGGTHTTPTGESTLRGMVACSPRLLDAGEAGLSLMDVHDAVAAAVGLEVIRDRRR